MVPVAGAADVSFIQSICSVIEEIELYDMDLFDLVVGALCKNEKKENPAGFNMMKVPHILIDSRLCLNSGLSKGFSGSSLYP